MSRKEAYYFSHDSNARHDEKILSLRMKHSWEGYGLYWAMVEKLREASDYSLKKEYNVIAFDLRTDAAKIKSIVEDFGLFAFTENGECFYSERMYRNMTAKSINAKKAAEARWSNRPKPNIEKGKNASAMQTHTKRNAIKVKESKVKKRKEDVEEKSDDDIFEFLETLKTKYLDSEKLIQAVLSVKKNKLQTKDQVDTRLGQFNDELKSKSIFQKPWNDYASHFLNWHRKTVGQNSDVNQQSRQKIAIG